MKYLFLLIVALAAASSSNARTIPSSGECANDATLRPVIYPDNWEELEQEQALKDQKYMLDFFETFDFSDEDLALARHEETERMVHAKVRQPRLKTMGLPEYPEQALDSGIDGNCEIIFMVSAEGRPIDTRAYCSNPIFITPALDFAKTIVFVPAAYGEQPIPRPNVLQPVRFCLP